MTDQPMDQDFDSKFGHLTKPLKEAALCWDIDLEEVVDSFLAKENDESAQMDLSHMLNFAQAGMLVSSVATNFGRKVEHLYTLVYQTLDSLSKGEGKSLATSALIKKMRKRIVGFQEYENGFELLDSQFKTPARGIDLAPGDGLADGSHIVRRVPLLLLPREDTNEKTKESGKPQSIDFKSSQCWISKSGCLLLDPDFVVYEESDRFDQGGRRSLGGRGLMSGPLIPAGVPMIPDEPLPKDTTDDLPPAALPAPIETSPSPEFGTPLGDNSFLPADEPPFSPVGLCPPLPQTPVNERPKRSREASAVKPAVVPAQPAVPVDYWKELDPHAVASTGRNIKMKVGVCYKRAPALKSLSELNLPTSCVDSLCSKSDLFALDGELITAAGLAVGTGRVGSSICSGKDALRFMETELILGLKEVKKKAAVQERERRKDEMKRQSVGGLVLTSDSESEEKYSRQASLGGRPSFGANEGGQLNSINDGAGISLVPLRSKEDRAIQAERERTALLEKVLEGSKHDYDEYMRVHLAAMLVGNNHDEPHQSGNAGLAAGTLVAAAGNSVQERIPELYANIRKWQDNLEPLLEEQNARPVFDLDDYLVSIIDKLKIGSQAPAIVNEDPINEFLRNMGVDVSDDDSMDQHRVAAAMAGKDEGLISSFSDLVKGQPKWNVCRMFLSTLILTNNGNVEIFNDDADTEDTGAAGLEGGSASPARPTTTPRGRTGFGEDTGMSPLRGSQTHGAHQSFQVKLRNADKNLKFAIQDNASVVNGVIPIITNKDVPAPEPVGDVPFTHSSDEE